MTVEIITAMEREVDQLLSDFQRACETVVVSGDACLSETTKERAVLRNALRARMIEAESELLRLNEPAGDTAAEPTLDWRELCHVSELLVDLDGNTAHASCSSHVAALIEQVKAFRAASANWVTIRDTQRINADRSARWMAGSPGWTTLEIAGELAGEVGELANVCKKLRRSELGVPGNKVSDEVLLQQARGEMADVMIVLMLTASKLGVDLQDAVCETFNAKSEQMGFPERIGS